jgi:hypothetical protein
MTRVHRRMHLAAWLVIMPAALGLLIAALVVRAGAESRRNEPTHSAGGRP